MVGVLSIGPSSERRANAQNVKLYHRISNTTTILYFNLYLYSGYAAHYVYMYMYIYIYVYVYMYIYMYIYIYVYIYIYIYVDKYKVQIHIDRVLDTVVERNSKNNDVTMMLQSFGNLI